MSTKKVLRQKKLSFRKSNIVFKRSKVSFGKSDKILKKIEKTELKIHKFISMKYTIKKELVKGKVQLDNLRKQKDKGAGKKAIRQVLPN